MARKGDAHRACKIHGDGVESLQRGLIEIGVPDGWHDAALAHVREVVRVNGASVFRWYKTAGKDELCGWWDDHEFNVLWVWRNNVHVRTEAVTVPQHRPTDWIGHDGHVGWLLPGAGGGPKRRAGLPRSSSRPHAKANQPAPTVRTARGSTGARP